MGMKTPTKEVVVDHSKFPIFAIAEKRWPAHKDDCSGYVRAVAADCGLTLVGLANGLVDFWNEPQSGWEKLDSAADAEAKSEAGYLVVAGKKEAGHGHVVIVVPGTSSHGDAMGYWGHLHGVGKEDASLSLAWKRSDLKHVQYFAYRRIDLAPRP